MPTVRLRKGSTAPELQRVVNAANDAIRALNSLAGEGQATSTIPVRRGPNRLWTAASPSFPNSQLTQGLEWILSTTDDFLVDASKESKPEKGKGGPYAAFKVGDRVPLMADQVKLPEAAGTAKLADLLPEDLGFYKSIYNILLDEEHWPPRSQPKRPKGKEYPKLLLRMFKIKMVVFRKWAKVVNGIFTVVKDPFTLRLIINMAGHLNVLLVDPKDPKLFMGDTLAKVPAQEHDPLLVTACDVPNFYYLIQVPEDYWPFQALPPIHGSELPELGLDDEWYYPWVTVACMGCSHTVTMSVGAHRFVVAQANKISRGPPIPEMRREEFTPKLPGLGIVIDDLTVVGRASHRAAIESFMTAYKSLVRHYFKVSVHKEQPLTLDAIEVIGYRVGGPKALLRRKPAALRSLQEATKRFAKRNRATLEDMQSLVGSWIFVLLVRRPLLSILQASFVWMRKAESATAVVPIWTGVKRELMMLVHLAPLIVAELKAERGSFVMASDASSTGYGVSIHYMDKPNQEWKRLLADPETYADEVKWSDLISAPIHHSTHINCSEAVANGLALIRAGQQSSGGRSRRILFVIDNTSALGGLKKGRSSSFAMNTIFRRTAAHAIFFRIYGYHQYVGSAHMPADGASRNHERK